MVRHFLERKEQCLIDHSGFLVLDIDSLLPSLIPDLLAKLAQHPSVFFCFVSPSGQGIKVVVRVSPIPTNATEHKGAFQACVDYFKPETSEFGFTFDPSGSDVARLCFLAFDPQAIFHPEAQPVEWDQEEFLEQQEAEQQERGRRIAQYDSLPSDAAVLDYIDPDKDTLPEKDNYSTWVSIGMAAKAAGLPFEVWDTWSQRGEKYNADEMRSKWQSFADEVPKGGVSWGSVVFLAREKGYRPKRTTKPIRLHQKSNLQCQLEPLENSREAIASAFGSGKNFVGLRADTGVGKTEQATQYHLQGFGGFFSVPTTELAKEIYDRFHKAEINVFRWRGVASEPDGEFPHEKPCMYPEQYIELAQRGRNAYKSLCESCPYITECEADGYRSQEDKAKKAQVVVAPHKDLLMNPTFRRTAARLLPDHPGDQITIDEFDILDSFLKIDISQARLEYLRDTWYDHTLGDFAKLILDACVVQNAAFTGISYFLEKLSEQEQQEIITALASLRVGNTIMDSDEAHAYEQRAGKSLDVESIRQRPIIEDDPDWNLLTKLELFFDVYKHAETAPLQWKDNTLTFYLPPLPLYTKSRVMLMSATLNETFFRQVFEVRNKKRNDVDFIDAHDTEWHPDAKVYQLRTNRNPRRTLLTGEKDAKGKWQYTSKLSDTGKQYLDRITKSIEQSDEKCGFIGHKAIIKNHTDSLDAAPGHFGGLIGLNQHFHRDEDNRILLHVLGSPNVGQEAVETAAKLLFGMTEAPLDFTRNDDGTYDDPNVQAVADSLVKSELTQGIGRAGLVKNPSTVVLWTSVELPSITHRTKTTLFDESDWDTAEGNLDVLVDVIAQREAQEAAEAEAIASGDVQAVMETKAVSERHARRLTQQPRAEKAEKKAVETAARDAKVIALHQQGWSYREIEEETGIGKSTVGRIVNGVSQHGHGHVTVPHEDVRNGTPPEKPVDTGVPAEIPSDENLFEQFGWDFREIDLRRDEIHHHKDVSELLRELSEDHPLLNFTDDEFLRIHYENKEITAVSIVYQNWQEAPIQAGGHP